MNKVFGFFIRLALIGGLWLVSTYVLWHPYIETMLGCAEHLLPGEFCPASSDLIPLVIISIATLFVSLMAIILPAGNGNNASN